MKYKEDNTVLFKNIDDRYIPCSIDCKVYSLAVVNIPCDVLITDIVHLLDNYVNENGIFSWKQESVEFELLLNL